MGTKCAVIYANLFMNHFEEYYIYNRINKKCSFYKRFIDDIFILWNGTLDDLKTFVHQLNTLHPTIKFDAKYSLTSIEFLDTRIYKSTTGKLQTTLYTKPTDRQSYLHSQSYHPSSCKRSIAYSQALRIRRICTEDSEYSKHTAKLLDKLVERGYDKTLTQDQINKVFQTPRNELLSTNTKPVNNPNILAVTYNKNLPDLRKAIDDNWKTLSINSNIAPLFTDKPVIAFRRNRNLKQLLCKHKLHNNKPIIRKEKKLGRCQPCLSRANNKCCKQMANTNHFTNRKNGRKFNIYHNLNCKSNNVIYLIECTLCNHKPYIGKSEPATNLRISNHRSDFKKQDSIPVDQHFSTPGHNFTTHARITLIEKLENTTYMTEEEVTTFLETREDFWMVKLDTLISVVFNQALNYPR